MQDTPTEIFPVLSQQVNMLWPKIHLYWYSQLCHNRSTSCDARYTHIDIPSAVTTGQHVVMRDTPTQILPVVSQQVNMLWPKIHLYRYSQWCHNRSTSCDPRYTYTDIPSGVTTGQQVMMQDTPTQIFPVLSQQVNMLWPKIHPHKYSQWCHNRSTRCDARYITQIFPSLSQQVNKP